MQIGISQRNPNPTLDSIDYIAAISDSPTTNHGNIISLPIFAMVAMPNHQHFVVRPTADDQVNEFFRRLSVTHTMRWHARTEDRPSPFPYTARQTILSTQFTNHRRMKSTILHSLLLLLVAIGCNHQPQSNELSPVAHAQTPTTATQPDSPPENNLGSGKLKPVFINYVLFVNDQEFDAQALFKKCSANQIELLESLEADGSGVLLQRQTMAEHTLPTDEALAFFGRGLSTNSIQRLKKCEVAISLTGVGPFDPRHRLLKTLTVATGKMAGELDAFVHDTADSLTFTPDAFSELRVQEIERGELSAAQFGVRAYRVEGGLRGVTMGLEKFGQSNVGIALFSEHHMRAVQPLMTLIMQRYIEADARIEPGPLELDVSQIRNESVRAELRDAISGSGTGKITLTFAVLEPESGDPQDLLGPTFKAQSGDALAAELDALLERLLGASRDISEGVSIEQLQEAIDAARVRAVVILNEKNAWTAPGRRFRVAVEMHNTREVVWVEAKSWNGKQGSGILLSAPLHTDGLKSGSMFEFGVDMIMDYTLSDSESVIDAGGIDELVKRLQSESQ